MSFIIGSERDENHISDSFISFAGAKFNLVQNGNSPNRYIWLHGDEQTARMALDYHIKHFAGLAFFIQNETREIPFKSTIVDPNRIFSRNGSYHALKKFKPGWQRGTLKQALDEIDSERAEMSMERARTRKSEQDPELNEARIEASLARALNRLRVSKR